MQKETQELQKWIYYPYLAESAWTKKVYTLGEKCVFYRADHAKQWKNT